MRQQRGQDAPKTSSILCNLTNNTERFSTARPLHPSQFAISKTADEMIVYHSCSLHVGIADGRADKFESARLQFFAHLIGFRSSRRHVRRRLELINARPAF